MRMLEKYHNNNSDNPLTSRRTDGGKKNIFEAQKDGRSKTWPYKG